MRTIRKTIKADLEEVFNLIYVSFSNMAESDLVKQLISDEDVLINLVIETSDIIVGNIVVSKLTMEPDVGLFCGGVAPLSVLPDHQSSGVGTQLMHEAIKNYLCKCFFEFIMMREEKNILIFNNLTCN